MDDQPCAWCWDYAMNLDPDPCPTHARCGETVAVWYPEENVFMPEPCVRALGHDGDHWHYEEEAE
jgi:hypothetical protein